MASLGRTLLLRGLLPTFRQSCCRGVADLSQAESHLANKLREKLPGASQVLVKDVSGGCGSMYEVFIEATEFKGLRVVQQHKLVTEALKDEIKAMHGLRISTAVAKDA